MSISFVVLVTGACSSGSTTVHRSASDEGLAVFGDASASGPASSNAYACATCHPSSAQASEPGARIFPGGSLAGALTRPTFWGGQETDLLRAINDCRLYFMGATQPWLADDEPAKAIYAWLATLPSAGNAVAAFTLVSPVADVPAGDAGAGAGVYDCGCRVCHGAVHTGEGLLFAGVPRLPDESAARFKSAGLDVGGVRLAFIEKTRHGRFLGLSGTMPPYAREGLSDGDSGSLLAFLGLY